MKTSVSQRAPRLVALLALAFATLSVSNLSAQNATVTTVPVGAVSATITASTNGTSYAVSQISFPLLGDPLVASGGNVVTPAGSLRGTIDSATTATTSSTITTSTGGWTAGQLAQAAYPMYVRLSSGAQAGLTLLITANTATTLTVTNQGVDLSTLAGASYEIKAGDTLLGLFGAGNLTGAVAPKGGTTANFTANRTDRVTINNGASVFNYYYNTDVGQWRRAGSNVDQGNVAISPQAGIVYSRIATTAYTITATGSVPVGNTIVAVARQGLGIYGRQFPTDTTLGDLGIQNIANWRKANTGGVTTTTSDRVIVLNGASLLSYYYDNTSSQWRRLGSGVNQNTVSISSGSSIRILRSGASGTDYYTLSPNYTL